MHTIYLILICYTCSKQLVMVSQKLKEKKVNNLPHALLDRKVELTIEH